MIKTFAPNTCAFDCEWVPCPNTARRLLHLSPIVPDNVVFQQIWAHYAKEGEDRPFLKLAISKVVSIAAVTRRLSEQGEIDLRLVSWGVDTRSESNLIQSFLENVAQRKYQLWGFNSSGSDLPILKQRAFVLDVPCPEFNKRPNKPWEGYDYHDSRNSEAHMDMMQLVARLNRAIGVCELT